MRLLPLWFAICDLRLTGARAFMKISPACHSRGRLSLPRTPVIPAKAGIQLFPAVSRCLAPVNHKSQIANHKSDPMAPDTWHLPVGLAFRFHAVADPVWVPPFHLCSPQMARITKRVTFPCAPRIRHPAIGERIGTRLA
jgi:hypothetical protein